MNPLRPPIDPWHRLPRPVPAGGALVPWLAGFAVVGLLIASTIPAWPVRPATRTRDSSPEIVTRHAARFEIPNSALAAQNHGWELHLLSPGESIPLPVDNELLSIIEIAAVGLCAADEQVGLIVAPRDDLPADSPWLLAHQRGTYGTSRLASWPSSTTPLLRTASLQSDARSEPAGRQPGLQAIGSAQRSDEIVPAMLARRPSAANSLARERTFIVPVFIDGELRSHVQTHAICLADSRRTAVYCDSPLASVASSQRIADFVVRTLDDRVRPAIGRWLGPATDLDENGRTLVLLTSHFNPAGYTSAGVTAFVRPGDLQLTGSDRLSNRAELIYVDPRANPGEGLAAILGHEYTHLAHQARCLDEQGASATTPDWFAEGLAHLAEPQVSPNQDNTQTRRARFAADPATCPLVVSSYAELGLWRHAGCRGAALSFLEWMSERTGESTILRHCGARDPLAAMAGEIGLPPAQLLTEWCCALVERGVVVPRELAPERRQVVAVAGTAFCAVSLQTARETVVALPATALGPCAIAIRRHSTP